MIVVDWSVSWKDGVWLIGVTITGTIVWQKLVDKVNGLGARVKRTETAMASLEGRMDGIEKQMAQIADIQGRVGQVQGRVEGFDSRLGLFQTTMLAQIADVKHTIVEKDSDIRQYISDRDTNARERIARLEVMNEIPHKDR